MTHTSTAVVPTTNGSRYLQQLCKHWSHKFAVEFDAGHGRVPFNEDTAATLDADADALTVRVDAPDAATLERMTRVVAEHLDRFAFREAPLAFDWR